MKWLRDIWDDCGWIVGLILILICWWGYDLVDDMKQQGIKPVLTRIWNGPQATNQPPQEATPQVAPQATPQVEKEK